MTRSLLLSTWPLFQSSLSQVLLVCMPRLLYFIKKEFFQLWKHLLAGLYQLVELLLLCGIQISVTDGVLHFFQD